jgi:nucleotide-binding universal stress UspA family protein
MYKHLLIATDGSELAEKALTQGVALAKAVGAKVTVVTVTEPWHAFAAGEATISFPIDEYEEGVTKWAEAVLSHAAKMAKDADVPCQTSHEKDQHAAEGILEAAERVGSDLIVMSSHGRRGLSRMLLGSQANKVVTQSACPVLICR